jgi:hypothetical protein
VEGGGEETKRRMTVVDMLRKAKGREGKGLTEPELEKAMEDC